MKVFGEFNKISEETKKRVPKLQKGQNVQYKLLHGTPNPDPDKRGEMIYPAYTRISTMFRIWDQGKNNGSGEFVDIGLVKGRDRDSNPIPAPARYFGPSGMINISAGNVQDEELYEIMELSDENESNPFRDTSVPAKYKRVDVVGDAKLSNRKRSSLTEALNYIETLEIEGLRELSAAMGWDESAEPDVLRDQVGTFAQAKPDELIKFVNDPRMKDKAIVKLGFSKGVLKYDPATSRVLWGKSGQPVASVEKVDGKNYLDIFFEWILIHKDGTRVLESIKKQVGEEIKKAA